MNELKIERLNWQPTWPNEIWITDKRGQEEFKITILTTLINTGF